MLSATLALLMQIGPNPSAGPAPAIPDELAELRRRQSTQSADPVPQIDKLRSCLTRAERDSAAARIEADSWLADAIGVSRAEALQCRGYAFANLGQWSDAASSFLEARDDSTLIDVKYRARLGAMAANALLTAGDNERALTVLDRAKVDAAAADFTALQAEIEIDRARAFVASSDTASANTALSEARRLAPTNARAWLLSATLARRSDNLQVAQDQIAQAGLLDPANAEIQLEAGLIAVLLGDDETARSKWEAVAALAPGSPQAQTAKTYLEQLDQL